MGKLNKISGNIKKYYLFQFFNSLEFFSPVIVLFWQANGLNFTQIMILQSIYAVGVIILELPTGAFADYFGKGESLALGSFFFTMGLLWYGLSSNFYQFVIGELACAAGFAFISGADRAFIHQTLKSINQEDHYTKIEGKTRSFAQIARTIGNFLGGIIGSISLGLTLISTGISTFIGFLIGLTFQDTKIELPREEKTEFVKIIKEGLTVTGTNQRLLWLTLFFAVLNGLMWTTIFYIQPYLKMLNIPTVYFGVFFSLFTLISIAGSYYSDKFEKLTGKNSFLIMGMVVVLSLFILGKFPNIYIIPLWATFSTIMIVSQTITSDKTLSLVKPDISATVLSFQNLLRRAIYAVAGPILGMVADRLGILIALQINSLILFVALGAVLLFYYRSIK